MEKCCTFRNLGMQPLYAYTCSNNIIIGGFHHGASQRLANKRPKQLRNDTYMSTVTQMKLKEELQTAVYYCCLFIKCILLKGATCLYCTYIEKKKLIYKLC